MANEVGAPVYQDLSGEFRTKLGVEFYPAWYVADRSGRIIESGRSAVSWVNREINSRLK